MLRRSYSAALGILAASWLGACDALAHEGGVNDAGVDASRVADAAASDAASDARDAADAARVDAARSDAGSDAGLDAGSDAGLDAALGDPEWVPLLGGLCAADAARHPELVVPVGIVMAAFRIEGRDYVEQAGYPVPGRGYLAVLVELETRRSVAALRTSCEIGGLASYGGDLAIAVDAPTAFGSRVDVWRARYDEVATTARLLASVAPWTSDIPDEPALGLGADLASLIDFEHQLWTFTSDGTATIAGQSVLDLPAHVGDDVVVHAAHSDAHDTLLRSAAGGVAGVLYDPGVPIAGFASDGGTLAWVEGGVLQAASYDGALHAHAVGSAGAMPVRARLGGGYYVAAELDASGVERAVVHRLIDGARASTGVVLPRAWYPRLPILLVESDEILLAPDTATTIDGIVRVDPSTLSFH